MNAFRTSYRHLIEGVDCSFIRYLYEQIDWSRRLIGLFGQQGVGKTTLLLQRLKLRFEHSPHACYLSLDDLWFQRGTLLQVAEPFCQAGGEYLFLDQVHYSPTWMEEVNQLMERFPSLHVRFAASNLLSEQEAKAGLRPEVACYQLRTLSFREYLAAEGVINRPPLTLHNLFEHHAELVREVNRATYIVPHFGNYLAYGCYPFYRNHPERFATALAQRVSRTLDVDLPLCHRLYPAGVVKVKRLLMWIMESAPFAPRPVDLARETGLLRSQTDDYMGYIQSSGLLRTPLYTKGELPRNQTVYPGNSNLLKALCGNFENRRQAGITFALDQLSGIAPVEALGNDLFRVDERYTLQAGDALGNYSPINNRPDAFAAIYGLPRSIRNRMPIWTLGFLY